MRGKKLDLTGQRFGKLVVLRETLERRRSYACWLTECACGTRRIFTTNSLCRKIKPTRSCGCLWKKPVGESARHKVLLSYKRNARTRGHVWELSDQEFVILTQANCHYCGRPPMGVWAEAELNGSYVYNGIDRKNDSEGYVLGNAVTCCKTCNWAKGKTSYVEFLTYIGQLVHYHNEKRTFSPVIEEKVSAAVGR